MYEWERNPHSASGRAEGGRNRKVFAGAWSVSAEEWLEAGGGEGMSTEDKCLVSHRGRAVRKWADWIGVNQDVLWDRQEGKVEIGHKGLDFKTSFAEQ